MEKSSIAIMVAIISSVTAILTTLISFKIKNYNDESETNKKVILETLDPLIIITDDLRNKLLNLIDRDKKKDTLLKDTLKQLSDNFNGR